MEQEKQVDVLHKEVGILNLNKLDIKQRVSEAVVSIKDGWTDPVEALIYAKKGELFFKELIEKVKPLAEDVQLGKGFSKFGVDISERMQGVKYDFSECGDVKYDELMVKKKELDQKVKEREEFLKTIKSPTTLVDDDSGEVYTVKPPIKTGKLGFVLKIK